MNATRMTMNVTLKREPSRPVQTLRSLGVSPAVVGGGSGIEDILRWLKRLRGARSEFVDFLGPERFSQGWQTAEENGDRHPARLALVSQPRRICGRVPLPTFRVVTSRMNRLE